MTLLTRIAALGFISSLSLSATANAQLTFSGLDCHTGLTTMAALACAGSFSGNNMNQQSAVLTTISSSFSSTTGAGSWWAYMGDPGFTGNTSGTVNFTSPVTGYFVILLKSSTNFSMYLYDGGTTGVNSINFTDLGVSLNHNGMIQGLSHASLYSWTGPPPTVTSTPEPSTIVLMASGFAGIVAFSRRRRA